MSCHILFFPHFILSNFFVDYEKRLALYFFCCSVNLLICLSAWAISEKAESPAICCFMNTVESAFYPISE